MTGRTNAGGGVQLPALTNPAAAGNIQSGYQAINGEGEVMTGTAAVREAIDVEVINNSNQEIFVSGVRLSDVLVNMSQSARTNKTYSFIKNSIFCVRTATGLPIDVESTQVYATLVRKDDLYAEEIQESPVVFTVT